MRSAAGVRFTALRSDVAGANPTSSSPRQRPGSSGAKKGGSAPLRPLRPAPSTSIASRSNPPQAATHRFPTPLVELALALVHTAGISLRGTVRVVETVSHALKLGWDTPHWTTVRNWLLRFGLARLRSSQQQADDWVFLVDHSVQIGKEKCLVGLGIRQAEYQRLNRCLSLEDMTLLHLEVMPRSTKEDVERSMKRLCQTVGVPRGVVNDNGADLAGGIRLLKKHYPQVRCHYRPRSEPLSRSQVYQAAISRSPPVALFVHFFSVFPRNLLAIVRILLYNVLSSSLMVHLNLQD